MTLSEKQQLFTGLIAKLITWANDRGMRLTFGEAYRTPEQAVLNAKKGSGIANSLHTQRLAVDFNLFVNGEYKPAPKITGRWVNTGNHWAAAGAGVLSRTRTVITSALSITVCADGQRRAVCAGRSGAGVSGGMDRG